MHMQRGLLCLLAGGLLFSGALRADDEKVFSGPQTGEKLTGFKVVGVHGDLGGKEIDFIAKADGKPLVLVFVHKLTRPSMAVTRVVTGYANSLAKEGVQPCIVWLAKDRTEAEQYLKNAAGSLNFTVPVGISLDGVEGPGAYGLNRTVELTILVGKDSKVVGNFALVQPSITDTPKIGEVIARMVNAKVPELKDLEAIAAPRRPATPRPNTPKPDDKPRPGKRPEDPRLVELLRGVIGAQNKPEDVKTAVEAVEKYVGDSKAKQLELGEAAKFIESLGYGTDPAKKQLRLWAEKYGAPEKK
jgi:hypothetical protein